MPRPKESIGILYFPYPTPTVPVTGILMGVDGNPPWSRASAPIWAHVSGYAPRLRGSSGLAFLRAFIDNSVAQKGDKRLFYAGYLHRADAWAKFSEAWDHELAQWPRIEYFKGSEASNILDGQFKGWDHTQRIAKVSKLAQIISAFEPFPFYFSLNRKLFEDILKPVSPYGLAQPHFSACFNVVSGVAQYAASQGITTPIEFIFDQQDGVDDDVRLFFSEMIKVLPQEARNLVADVPWFKNDRDKQFMPLQAADMLAWHVRREHEYPDQPLPLLNKLLHPDGFLVGEIPDDVLRKWTDHHSKLPGVPLVQSQAQWRDLKQEIRHLKAAGIDPSKITGPGIYYPEGTPLLARLIDKMRRLFSD